MKISLIGLSAVALRAEITNPGVSKKSQHSADFAYQVMTLENKNNLFGTCCPLDVIFHDKGLDYVSWYRIGIHAFWEYINVMPN